MSFPELEGVGTLDLNLDNEWWTTIMTEYLNSDNFEKWFISTAVNNVASFRSDYSETRNPKETNQIVIDYHKDAVAETTRLREEFADYIYPFVE